MSTFIGGVLLILFCAIGVINPTLALQLEDMFRIRGKREYTFFAVAMVRIGSVLGIILGIIMIREGFTQGQ